MPLTALLSKSVWSPVALTRSPFFSPWNNKVCMVQCRPDTFDLISPCGIATCKAQDAAARSDAQLVFIGDSITEGCGTCRRGCSDPGGGLGLGGGVAKRLSFARRIVAALTGGRGAAPAAAAVVPSPPWLADLGQFNPVALGISGDRTEQLLWRIQHGVRCHSDPPQRTYTRLRPPTFAPRRAGSALLMRTACRRAVRC